jgi:hypothetical protein
MRNVIGLSILVLTCCGPAWGNYGPELSRTDAATEVLACQQAHFAESDRVATAMKSRRAGDALRVLGGALRELRHTPETAALYSARAFCVHELVPNSLLRPGRRGSIESQPTDLVTAFSQLGIEYFYYDPAAEWTLRSDPVDLNELAEKHLDSRWGREAFLMMTLIGWSQGDCAEGPDQFREVIKRGEMFLKRYPRTETSDHIRLELANAYATWWNVSRAEPNPGAEPPFSPEAYEPGAEAAKEKAIDLYRQFLAADKWPSIKVRDRLQKLRQDPKGSKTYDYYCPEYED